MVPDDLPSCPLLEDLDHYVTDDSQDESISRHVKTCDSCAAQIDRIKQNAAFLSEFAGSLTSGTSSGIRSASIDIEGYEVLAEIHRGGQGIVYRAVQQATHRTVALKVMLQGGMATSRQRRRFEREIELAASLRHPNIVTIHDSGETEDGNHFFAMELIDGRPLDHFLAAQLLDGLRPTLALFSRICTGVSFAHQRGVIHRDLKPANILVDSDAEPHVLDFGLAKALIEDEQAVGLAVTVTGQFMGTLAYASPEQISGKPDQIDTRSDVYALGVILYEMLTGHMPYDVTGRPAEVLTAIVERDPQPPSTWSSHINNEIETIVLKALAKNKERRYQSVDQLRGDVEHYLAGEPIDAKRDSTWYVLRKAVGRHRGAFSAAAVFLLLLSAFAVTMFIQRQTIALGRDRATQTAQYLTGIFRQFNYEQSGGAANITARNILDDGAGRIDEIEDLVSRAEVMDAIGSAYKGLGLYDDAAPLLQDALRIRLDILGADHLDVAHSLNLLGGLRHAKGEHEEAERLYRRALAVFRGQLGNEHREVAVTLSNLASLAHFVWVDYVAAEQMYREALDINRTLHPQGHRDTAASLNRLAHLVTTVGQYQEAERLYEEALTIFDQLGISEDVQAAHILDNLGWLLLSRGELDAAEDRFRSALAMFDALHGPEHPDVAGSMNDLAVLLLMQGEYTAAEDLCQDALAIRRMLYGENHLEVAQTMNNLAWSLAQQGKTEQAESLCIEALETRRRLLGEEHPDVAISLLTLADILESTGDLDRAEPLCREALRIRQLQFPTDHPDIAVAQIALGEILTKQGQAEEAQTLLRDSLRIRRSHWKESHWRVAVGKSGLGEVLTALGRYQEAEPLLLGSYPSIKAALGDMHKTTVDALKRIIALYDAWDKPDEAAQWRAKLPDEVNSNEQDD